MNSAYSQYDHASVWTEMAKKENTILKRGYRDRRYLVNGNAMNGEGYA